MFTYSKSQLSEFFDLFMFESLKQKYRFVPEHDWFKTEKMWFFP